ncbi:Zn-ribbon domain-containing OB-fold protein [Acrocarpospora catenulata]|uniref:Zn-ribbon domain-containing OB-fold protein n=1 Tax=Acrocarpospora catenulata TaxID=2836182 RepID=UPI001BD9BC32|nr:OB-fold domain-containing protein [Acrocarpospora catenulata]
MTADRPRPVPTRETRPFWDGLAAYELRIPWCATCGRYEHPGAVGCPRCLGDLEWRAVSGRAAVVSWTVVRRAFTPGFTPPYVVAQVSLAEQPDLWLDTAIDADPASLRTGLPVAVVFHDDLRGFSVYGFRPVDREPGELES